MLIGVLSDTHGRIDTTATAIRLLQSHRVEHIIHCGDVGSVGVLDLLMGTPASFVWGNCDYDTHSLKRHSQAIGIQCFGAIGRITFDGKIISFMHGDDYRMFNKLIEAQECDLLLHGHTHCRRADDFGKVRVVNPGALHRAQPKTVALIESSTRNVQFIEVQ